MPYNDPNAGKSKPKAKPTRKKPSNKKRDSNPFGPDFLVEPLIRHTREPRRVGGNLLGDIEGFAKGAGPAILNTAIGLGEDVQRIQRHRPTTATGGAADAIPYAGFLSSAIAVSRKKKLNASKIAEETAKQYKYTYGPLFSGDKEEFYKRVTAHPLGPVLDAMTLATLGGSAAARTGLVVAKRTPAGSKAARVGEKVSRTERRSVPAGSTAEIEISKLPVARKGIGREPGSLTRRSPGVATKSGDEVLSLKKRELRTGERVDDFGFVHPNPVFQGPAQAAYDAISNAFWGAPIVGSGGRIARADTRRIRTADRRAKFYGTQAARQAGKIDEADQALAFTAVRNTAEGVEPAERIGQLERDMQALQDPTAVRSARQTRAKIQSRQAARKKAGMPKSEELDFQARQAEGLIKASKQREAIIPQMQAKLEAQRKLAETGLPTHLAKPVGLMVDLFRKNSDALTEALRTAGIDADPARAVTSTQRIVGRRPSQVDLTDTFPLPQTVDKTIRRSVKQSEGIGYSAGRKSRKPDSGKFRSGYAYRFGLETLDPRNAVWANDVAQKAAKEAKTVDLVMASGKRIPFGDTVPKGFVRLKKNDKLREYVSNLRAFADDEAPLIFGDSPQLSQIQQRAFEIIDNLADDKYDFVVPKKYHKRMLAELEPYHRVKGLDTMNAIWRTATVSALRPAFLTNNVIGQSVLLLMAHSPYKLIRNRIGLARLDDEAREFFDANSSGVIGHGQAGSIAAETKMLAGDDLERVNKAREVAVKANDVLGRIGQAISDDPYRRFAFSAEVLPRARRLQAARLKNDPATAFTIRDAMEELLSDDKFMDSVERKVLDDLVDFEDLTPVERRLIRRYISPFYSWVKGSSRLAGMWVGNHPLRAQALYNLGGQAVAENEESFGGKGKIPHFLGGITPIGASGGVTTHQYNPFLSASDSLQQLAALAGKSTNDEEYGPSNLIAGSPPVTKAAFSAWGKLDPFTGRRVPGESPVRRAANVYASAFPQVQSIQRLQDLARRRADAAARGSDANQLGYVFQPSLRGELLKYVGVPYRRVSRDGALAAGSDPTKFELYKVPLKVGDKEFTLDPASDDLIMTTRISRDDIGKSRGRGSRSRRSR